MFMRVFTEDNGWVVMEDKGDKTVDEQFLIIVRGFTSIEEAKEF